FPEAKQLARFIPELADKIARLKRRAKAAKVPVIYVNDNFGRWRSDFRALIEHCRKGKARSLIEQLYPEQADYFVLKPKHSGFLLGNETGSDNASRARFISATGQAADITMVASENVANVSARSYRQRRIRKKQNEFA